MAAGPADGSELGRRWAWAGERKRDTERQIERDTSSEDTLRDRQRRES